MGLFKFIQSAGEKLFGGKEAAAAPASDADGAATQAQLDASAAQAITKYIQAQNLNVTDLHVTFDGSTGKVTVKGTAATQQDAEKVILSAGNVANVTEVDNQLSVTNPQPEAQYHDVEKGDTLSAIAKKYYGDANKYMVIFEANKPMLSDPDKIYPGQKLRIPPL